MESAIAKAQNPPGYTRTLDRAQAQGSLYLRSCGSGVLAFAPGVGKTDTAIGAALELMNSEPDKHHRVLIVAPATAMANAWAKTIQQTCPGKSLAILGLQGPEAGGEAFGSPQLIKEMAAKAGVRVTASMIEREGPEDSAGLDWSPINAPAEAQRKAAGEALTQVNRELLNDMDSARQRSNSLVSQKIQQGCFDAFDSLSYSVFGKTILPTNLQALLGVNGTAQIMAHELQKNADDGSLDLQKLKDSIDEITDERQSQIMRLDLNRARFATKEAQAMSEEYKLGMEGEGLYTPTAALSRRSKKIREAAACLGYAVSGSEALHTLKSMLGKNIQDVVVEGFGSPQLTRFSRGRLGRKTVQDSTGRLSTPQPKRSAKPPVRRSPRSTVSCSTTWIRRGSVPTRW
jgi:uncharacterized membrane protein